MPSLNVLLEAGVSGFSKKADDAENGPLKDPPAPTQIDVLLSKMGGDDAGNSAQPPMPLVTIGTSLPALSKKLVAKRLANEYIDFTELPPAKGKAGILLSLSGGRFWWSRPQS